MPVSLRMEPDTEYMVGTENKYSPKDRRIDPVSELKLGPWPSSRCTTRAASSLINDNVHARTPREEVLFQVLASLVERALLDINDFWGPLSFELEAELRIRATLRAADNQAHVDTAEVSE